MAWAFVRLTDRDGTRSDVRVDLISRITVLTDEKAKTCIYLDTETNNVVWVQETIEKVYEAIKIAAGKIQE